MAAEFERQTLIRRMKRIEWLRDREMYVYQAAFYLLNEERQALEAAQQALLAAAADESFFALPLPDREMRLRRLVIREALAVRASAGICRS